MKIYYITENKCKDLTPKISEKQLIKILIASGLLIKGLNNPLMLYAYEKGAVGNAVQPFVDMLIDLSEPVSYGFMVKGFIQWMAGEENKAKKTIKASSCGYLGIQFIPQIFNIIKTVKLD